MKEPERKRINTWKGRDPVALGRGDRHPLDGLVAALGTLRHEHTSGGSKTRRSGAESRVRNSNWKKRVSRVVWILEPWLSGLAWAVG